MATINLLKIRRLALFPLAMIAVGPTASLAASVAGGATACPPGYEPAETGGRRVCITPPQLTFRGLEPCEGDEVVLVVDHRASADRCVQVTSGAAADPRCQTSYLLEIKPGKDRCWREEPRRQYTEGDS